MHNDTRQGIVSELEGAKEYIDAIVGRDKTATKDEREYISSLHCGLVDADGREVTIIPQA